MQLKKISDYEWNFSNDEIERKKYILEILREKIKIRKIYYARLISKEESNLKKLNDLMSKFFSINRLIYERKNGSGKIYFELNINKKEDIKKLIELKVISKNVQRNLEKN
ncbi:MAG: hypothetical protein Q8N88_03280 [Nanoarchaeota archaeon]|nr:hypothetical protein [Nanoarchaeota archaeon]